MASEEHLKAASVIKNTHYELRLLSSQIGPDEAWSKHLKNKDVLKTYAKTMRELEENHWRMRKDQDSTNGRISWTINYCEKYFQEDELERLKQKDLRAIELLRLEGEEIHTPDVSDLRIGDKLEVLDVGSSGNFFKSYERFNILPIDISPPDDSVFFCDFLTVPIGDQFEEVDSNVTALPLNRYHVIIFSLLLEYLPSSDQRIKCCQKAYRLLRPQGILIIITPDSNKEKKNSKQIKNWRWTLANIGFRRVKVEKLKNLTCMSFRKSLDPLIPLRWSQNHKEPYMEFKLEIPQDRKNFENCENDLIHKNLNDHVKV